MPRCSPGLFRFKTPHNVPVEVYSQSFDPYGRPSWMHVATIYPFMFVNIPGVPAGAVLGFQTAGGGRVWPPLQVGFPGGMPFVTYTVPP